GGRIRPGVDVPHGAAGALDAALVDGARTGERNRACGGPSGYKCQGRGPGDHRPADVHASPPVGCEVRRALRTPRAVPLGVPPAVSDHESPRALMVTGIPPGHTATTKA